MTAMSTSISEASPDWPNANNSPSFTAGAIDTLSGQCDSQSTSLAWKLVSFQSRVLASITEKSSTTETLKPIFEAAKSLLQYDAIGIEVVSHRTGLIHHLRSHRLHKSVIEYCDQKAPEDRASVGAAAMASGKVQISKELNRNSDICDAEFLDRLEERDLHSFWAAPLRYCEGEILGAVTLYFSKPRIASEEDLAILAFITDLANHAVAHRRNRDAKKVADERFSVLVENLPGVVYQRTVTPDEEIRYTYISDGAQDLFGVSAEEIISDPRALFDTHDEGYREDFRERLLEASRNLTMWDVEATIVSRTGEKKYTHAIAKPARQRDGTVVWNGVILDSTRIKQAEMQAAVAEKHTRFSIVESLEHGFIMFDQDQKLVISNSKLRAYYPELDRVLSEETTLDSFLKSEVGLGITSPAENSGGTLDVTGERELPNGIWLLVQRHESAGGETVILYTDITKIKARETALERSNRELQDFASVASHDLQEPLRKIEAFGDRLQARYGDELGEQGGMYLERMQSAASRMRSLINDLLVYSRVTTKGRPFTACDLTSIVDGVLSDLQVPIEESNAKITVGDLPTIDSDAFQMRQLCQNIIGNALKYRKADVAPEIAFSSTQVFVSGKECTELQISDNGIGFDMAYAEKIFAIFQRLHGNDTYMGTGIGLATCRKIAERHGGAIRAESVEGSGTTIIILLPVRQLKIAEV